MTDPRYEFFNTSVDQEANRALVQQISAAAVASLRPKEAEFTTYAFDEVLRRAARGEVMRVGAGTEFGLGGAELLLFVVVPLVTSALTAAFVTMKVAGIGGVAQSAGLTALVSRQDVDQIIRQSRLRVRRQEADRLWSEINGLIAEIVARASSEQAGQRQRRCGAYDCAALRQCFINALSLDELRALCFDLGEPHEEIIVATLGASVINLIEHFARRGRLDELVSLVRSQRPHIDWSALMH